MCIDELIDLKKLTGIERQRVFHANNLLENDRKDLQFLITSLVFAGLFQAQYRFQVIKCLNISIEESHEMYIIYSFEYENPLIFEIKRREDLKLKMINLLQNLLRNLPLLIGTLLFMRCYSIHEYQPLAFHQMPQIIIEKFSNDKHNQEAVFIALKQKLKKTLYHWDENYANKYEIEEEIVKHIENYSSELLDIFAKNLDDYLYDKSNHNYLSNPTVNYIKIAYQAIKKNYLLFQKLIQKCFFAEGTPKEVIKTIENLEKKPAFFYEQILLYSMNTQTLIHILNKTTNKQK
ncbi:hypothetical protein I4U23_002062 [Adineta vaga]|nr:hypothetical protein I4U23_002062 [Adineta vaga]